MKEYNIGCFMKKHIASFLLLLILLVCSHGTLGKKAVIEKQTAWPTDTRSIAVKDKPVSVKFLSASHAGN
jgi:hypothetical protein